MNIIVKSNHEKIYQEQLTNTAMDTFFYAAYGSNLHPIRLKERCPSASLIGTTSISSWKLSFRKRSSDGSSKCDAEKTNQSTENLYIAVYKLFINEEETLDRIEGYNKGYDKISLDIVLNSENINVKMYIANKTWIIDDLPYSWYKEMVLSGARYNNFPQSYIEAIQSIPAKKDFDEVRNSKNMEIVTRMSSD